MSDFLSELQQLVDARKEQGRIKDAAEAEYDRLGGEISVLMTCNDVTKIRVGDWNVTLSDRSRDSISRDALVELGVGTDIILAATKKSPFTVVDIRKAGGTKQEAA